MVLIWCLHSQPLLLMIFDWRVEHTRVLNVVYRSATVLGSRLPSIASAKVRVAGVSSGTQGVMKRAQNVAQAVVRTRSSLSSWSCMGARHRNVGPLVKSTNMRDLSDLDSVITETTTLVTEEVVENDLVQNKSGSGCSGSGSRHHDSDEEEDRIIPVDSVATITTTATSAVEITDGELWYELEKELQRRESETDINAIEEEATAAKEITEEENMLADSRAVESKQPISSSDVAENLVFFPPGRIMHMVSVPSSDSVDLDHECPPTREHVGIYETPRELYCKLRLSKTMIKDHYMPMYKKMMEFIIEELENDQSIPTVL